MKFCLVLVLFVAVVYGQGIPTRKCPPGEHSVLYCPRKAEPTCDNPMIHELPWKVCDIPDCFCNEPTVRDTKTNKCIPFSECKK